MTSDGGKTWQDDTPSSSPWWATAIFAGSGRLWLIAQPGTILSRPLSGGTWTEQTTDTVAYLYGIALRASGRLVAVGQGGTMLSTDDAGVTWTPRSRGVAANFTGVDFTGVMNGWAVGSRQWPEERRGHLHDQRRWRHLAAANGRRRQLVRRRRHGRREPWMGRRLGRCDLPHGERRQHLGQAVAGPLRRGRPASTAWPAPTTRTLGRSAGLTAPASTPCARPATAARRGPWSTWALPSASTT